VFNNAFLHFDRLPDIKAIEAPHLQLDANLYWQPGLEPNRAESFFAKYRSSAAFQNSRQVYPPGFDANSLVADPNFVRAESDPTIANDYRPTRESPLVDRGVELPADWPDPLREQDQGRPDIGAIPLGVEIWKFGRDRVR
jgi:hypothetical protein